MPGGVPGDPSSGSWIGIRGSIDRDRSTDLPAIDIAKPLHDATPAMRSAHWRSRKTAHFFDEERLPDLCPAWAFPLPARPLPGGRFRPMQVEKALLYAARLRTCVSPIPR